MIVDDPKTLAEMEANFAAYERALVGNEAIRAFRAARSPVGLARTRERTVITTYGRDLGIAATMFRRASAPGKIGRQMQTWVRFPQGWRIVAAHISVIDEPKGI